MRIELEREDDGRWIAEIPELPGVMVYGATREQAISKVKALALRTMADQICSWVRSCFLMDCLPSHV
ncbi:MAG TPA: type II toxin-antitoxin system HicB family antitoxin [Desulfonatronum sp.]|nr:type II toxin-antitoxin system HicB family antitoxin [Desulfonatronum sp.]